MEFQNNLTLDQMRVLIALAETGSVRGAAVRMRRAQSAISYAIRLLEENLELPLVNREGYRSTLSPTGETILSKCREAVQVVEDLSSLATQLRQGAEPYLNILVDGILPVSQLMPVYGDLSSEDNPTRVDLRIELLGGVMQAMESESPDIVLAPLRLITPPTHYAWESIGMLVMVPVAATEHPLSRHPPPIPLRELRRHVHLVVTSPSDKQVPVDSGLIGARRRWNFPDFHSRLEGLRAGLGFAWMPSYMVEEDLRQGVLAPIIPEDIPLYRSEVALITRRDPPLGPTGRMIRERLREIAGFPPPPAEDLLRRYEITYME